MTIDSRWLQKDFKQKYYLFCREKEFKVEKFNYGKQTLQRRPRI
jgi:hypothetical protein